MTERGEAPLVLVTVGMDHQRFDRLMRWVESWLLAGAADRVRCLVQTGPASPPPSAECRDYLPYGELEDAMRRAAVVACHAGPGSIMMCRWNGHVPVVVPRLTRFGEVVDDHQVTFARTLANAGHVRLAEEEAAFHGAMEDALAAGHRAPGADLPLTGAVAQIERLVNDLVRPGEPAVR